MVTMHVSGVGTNPFELVFYEVSMLIFPVPAPLGSDRVSRKISLGLGGQSFYW